MVASNPQSLPPPAVPKAARVYTPIEAAFIFARPGPDGVRDVGMVWRKLSRLKHVTRNRARCAAYWVRTDDFRAVRRVRILPDGTAIGSGVGVTLLSLDEPEETDDDSERVVDRHGIVTDPTARAPHEEVETWPQGFLDQVFRRLTAAERHVAVEHLLRERTLAEIGVDLGLTESRICQLADSARRKMRGAVRTHFPELYPGR